MRDHAESQMKGASLLYRFPLSVTLSLLLLLVGALFMGAYVAMLWGAQRETILRNSTRALTGEITRQQRHLQEHLDEGDLSAVQNELASLGTDLRVRLALLSDPEGTILAALRRADIDRPMAASLGAVEVDPLDPGLAATFAEVRTRRGHASWRSPRQDSCSPPRRSICPTPRHGSVSARRGCSSSDGTCRGSTASP